MGKHILLAGQFHLCCYNFYLYGEIGDCVSMKAPDLHCGSMVEGINDIV